MKRFIMIRKIIVVVLLVSVVSPLKGQTFAEDVSSWAGEWKAAFSGEGRKSWKPEFTIRYSAGFISEGPLLTGGVRIDDKRTLGIMIGQACTFVDAIPESIYHIQTAIYKRRYFHFRTRDIVALYSDVAVGASWVYKVYGGYLELDDETGGTVVLPQDYPGDVRFHAAWEPGIRFRFFRNAHLFLGPTIATDRIGLHLGLGF